MKTDEMDIWTDSTPVNHAAPSADGQQPLKAGAKPAGLRLANMNTPSASRSAKIHSSRTALTNNKSDNPSCKPKQDPKSRTRQTPSARPKLTSEPKPEAMQPFVEKANDYDPNEEPFHTSCRPTTDFLRTLFCVPTDLSHSQSEMYLPLQTDDQFTDSPPRAEVIDIDCEPCELTDAED